MQFSHALIALVAAGLANAQLPDVPACSLNCFVSALTSDGCSTLTDFACHCAKTQLISDITPCVEKACKIADQASVSNIVVSQCSAAGVPISVAPILTSESSSATTTSSSSSSGPASTSASETASETASSSAGTTESSASASTGTPSVPTGSTTPSSGAVSGSTPAGTSTPLVSKTSGSTAATTSPAYNAGANVKGNLAGAAVMAAAAAYIL
ncbi:GPI-anchored CFEM domain protein B [Penicillium longicatenatum]|uniref:GPI-anchored CFEM domain protein B n=1 Tax=Penicillium longicatenatum TaxID=1561947 RepID=UPI002548FC48|nr:GPI-anchored CFEM domain protein B [Penicillium longicatenatum]KAJ5643416.1 GPI-anchored CFEM domain protein B [Penicillium longicatenatum]